MIPYTPDMIPLLTLPWLPFARRKSLPKCRALYFVFDGQGNMLYLGQASSLYQRWQNHHRDEACEQHGAQRIAWLSHEDHETLHAFENACLAYFTPPLNTHITARCYPAGQPMKKINVYLTDPQYDTLKALATRTNRPMADCLRQAMAEWLDRQVMLLMPRVEDIATMSREDLATFVENLAHAFGEMARRPMGGQT